MGNQVSNQLLVFGQSILLGLCAGLLYDLLRPFRLRLPRLTGLLDSLYCLLAGTAVFLFLLRGADGQLRGFVVLGALGGAVLFFGIFSALLRPVWAFWADTMAKMLYNKKKRTEVSVPERRRRTWQKKSGPQGEIAAFFAPVL